jgi:hypothetical protein
MIKLEYMFTNGGKKIELQFHFRSQFIQLIVKLKLILMEIKKIGFHK